MMLRTILTRALLLTPLLLGTHYARAAQDTVNMPPSGAKTVEVTRTFAPSVQDADKIAFLPTLTDSAQLKIPPMEYRFGQRPVFHQLPLRAIPAAQLGAEAVSPIAPFFIKAGFGNYLSPMLEAYYSGKRKENYTLSAKVAHRSAWGTVRLFDKEKVRAPYSRTSLEGSCEANVENISVEAYARYAHHYDNFYGRDSLREELYNPLWQQNTSAHHANLHLAFHSLHLDTNATNYGGLARYNGYFDSRSMNQSHAKVQGFFEKRWIGRAFGTRVTVDYFHKDFQPKVAGNLLISALPWVRFFGDKWRVEGGVDFTFDRNNRANRFYFFPKAHISYDLAKSHFIPFIELDGGLEMGDYKTLRDENPWILPGLYAPNTARLLDLTLGIKGNFSTRASYSVQGSYAIMDSARFYANQIIIEKREDGTLAKGLGSGFDLVYDRLEQVHARAAFDYRLQPHFSLGIVGEYWFYITRTIEEPWHKPQFQLTLHADYNIQRKIYIGMEFYLQGGRKAQLLDGTAYTLPFLYDLNLHLRYRFVSDFSIFLDACNIIACKSDIYYRYPMHRFNAMLGVSYAF